MARRRADLILGVVVAAFSAYVLSMALNLTMFSKNVPGPGLFPMLVASMMLALGVLLAALCIRDLVRWRHVRPPTFDEVAAGQADAPPVESGPSEPRRIGRASAVFACYVVAMPLMSILGFVPAAAVLVVLVLFGVEGRRDWRALSAAVLIPVAAFYLFIHLLSIQLPSGLLDLGPFST